MLIEYSLTDESPLDISVFDVQGRLIQTLVKSERPLLTGFWFWNDTEQLIPGMYLVQLRTENGVVTRKAMKL